MKCVFCDVETGFEKCVHHFQAPTNQVYLLKYGIYIIMSHSSPKINVFLVEVSQDTLQQNAVYPIE
jgi:hypothetical protein